MKWLIHELTHVAQMEHAGSQYLIEAFHAQVTEGYGYTPGEKLYLRDYNREQQASIIADYYIKHISGISTEVYEPYIAELRAREL
jgi:bifunctional pyridoxal-dependent enzyme with beta-cystathionase and maltose regulon repressor activities